MVVLAGGSLISGYLVNPQWDLFHIPSHWFSHFVIPALAAEMEILPFNMGLAIVTTTVAVVFIGLATVVYLRGRSLPKRLDEVLSPARLLISQKYYMDELYEHQVVAKGFYRYLSGFLDWFDQQIVDGVADVLGWFSRNVGWALGRLQSGQAQSYAMWISMGILLILVVYLVWG